MKIADALGPFIANIQALIKSPKDSSCHKDTPIILNRLLELATLVEKLNRNGGIKSKFAMITNAWTIHKIKTKSEELGVKSLQDIAPVDPKSTDASITASEFGFEFNVDDLDLSDVIFRGVPPVLDEQTKRAARHYIACLTHLEEADDLATQFAILPQTELSDWLYNLKICVESNIDAYQAKLPPTEIRRLTIASETGSLLDDETDSPPLKTPPTNGTASTKAPADGLLKKASPTDIKL